MDSLLLATREALYLLLTFDTDLWAIVRVSFMVSLKAIVIAAPVALCLALPLAYLQFPGRHICLSLVNTWLALPAVVVGLILYMLLSRSGPAGDWKLLFTQTAMVLGQIVLCLPILVAMGHSALQSGDRRAWDTARTLGAGPVRAIATTLYEVRFGLVAALIAGFSRIIAEVGSSMMIGGNILHHTRNIPTAIALETSKGAFVQGIALGIVLITLALFLNLGLGFFQGRGVSE